MVSTKARGSSEAKVPKSKGKKVRFVFGREKPEDSLIRAIKKMCEEAGVEFIPSKKTKKKKANRHKK